MKKMIISIVLPFLTLLCSYSEEGSELKGKSVDYRMNFVAFDKNSGEKLESVEMVVINMDGKVVDVLKTDRNGEAEKKITAHIDKRYFVKNISEPIKRGTVTVIAYKKGYCETVIFEVPISISGAYQPFTMFPIIPGQRNEPIVQLGDTHHLEIISLVEKYRLKGTRPLAP